MNARELRRFYETEGPAQTCQHVREALAEGHLQPRDFSLRELAEEVVPGGREWVRQMDPRSSGRRNVVLTEADGVDVTAFADITGQLIFSAIHQGYSQADFVCSRLIDTIPTRLDGEKIPGVEALDPDGNEVVEPGMPFPHVGFGQRYTTTPSTDKRGMIVPVTKEAIFFDRTAMVLRNAAGVGEALGTNKEKRCADVVIGAVNNYNENSTPFDTYQTATPWINTASGTELIDWTDIDAAEQLLAGILDPTTGEPVTISSSNMTLLAMPAKNHAARRILNATETRSGDVTSGAGAEMLRVWNCGWNCGDVIALASGALR